MKLQGLGLIHTHNLVQSETIQGHIILYSQIVVVNMGLKDTRLGIANLQIKRPSLPRIRFPRFQVGIYY